MFKMIQFASAVVLLATVSAANAVPGFVIQDSRGLGGVSAVLNFSSSGGSSDFNAGNGNPDAAFPNGTGDNFNLSAHGFINVDVAGDYTFAVNQDDQVFVTIGQSGGPVTIIDTGCCSTTTYTRTLEAGTHFIAVNFRELGGGESLEFSSAPGTDVPFGIPAFTLVNDAGNSLKVATEATDFVGVNPIIGLGAQGFNVIRQDSNIGVIDNITEAETVFATGGAPEFFQINQTIKFGRTVSSSPGTDAFPGGGGDQFIIHASGFLDVQDPDGMDEVFFYVSSDDGFRLRINGDVVSEFETPTGNSNTMSGLVSVKDGDFLEVLMFEKDGGEAFVFARDLDGDLGTVDDRFLIGDAASGLLVFAEDNFGPAIVPEPTTASLALLSMTLIGMRRRRQKVAA